MLIDLYHFESEVVSDCLFEPEQPLLSLLSPHVVSCIISTSRNHAMTGHHDAEMISCDRTCHCSSSRRPFDSSSEFAIGNAFPETHVLEFFPDGVLERGAAVRKIEIKCEAFALQKILQLPRGILEQR